MHLSRDEACLMYRFSCRGKIMWLLWRQILPKTGYIKCVRKIYLSSANITKDSNPCHLRKLSWISNSYLRNISILINHQSHQNLYRKQCHVFMDGQYTYQLDFSSLLYSQSLLGLVPCKLMSLIHYIRTVYYRNQLANRQFYFLENLSWLLTIVQSFCAPAAHLKLHHYNIDSSL